MSEEKKDQRVNLNCPVPPEFAERFDRHWKERGAKGRTAYLRRLIEEDMAGTKPAPEGQPPPAPVQPHTPGVTAAEVRRELATLAYLLLSANGRVGSSEAALRLVGGYLDGTLHEEVNP